MNLFELFVKIGVDDQASDKLSRLSSKLGNGLKTAAKVGAAAVGAASAAIVALGKIGLEYNSQMEQYTTNFTTMLGSQEAAVKKVEELKKFAASTPLSMDDLAKGTQTLLAFGVESENSTKILRQLGDIALGDADKMQRLSTAFGKATAAGKVTGDTVQQMIDAGWNPLIQISKAAGETMEETQKRMSAGAISVEELQAAMEAVTTGTGQFAGGMEAASHTTQGLISTLQDNARALVGEVFTPISQSLIGSVLPTAIKAIDGLTNGFRENGIDGMISATEDIISDVISFISANLPQFVATAVNIVNALIGGITTSLPQIIQAGIGIIVELIKGIGNALPAIIGAAPEIIRALVKGLWDAREDILEAGKSIVNGIKDGIKAAWDGLVRWFNDLWDSLFNRRTVDVSVNATSVSKPSGASLKAGGSSYVPYDGYIASLHRGEAILTERQADEWRQGGNKSGITIVQNIQSVPQTAVQFAAATAAYFEQARWVTA